MTVLCTVFKIIEWELRLLGKKKQISVAGTDLTASVDILLCRPLAQLIRGRYYIKKERTGSHR